MRIYMEIRGCTGGDEANLFAQELMRMYFKFCRKHSLKCDIVNSQGDIVLLIDGKEKWISLLINETGVHKVQRPSVTSKNNKTHTSTASVAVLEVPKVKTFLIDEHDITFSAFRGTGCGGQHRNKTDSAVRAKHEPTGITVVCQNERSQHQNKAYALEILESKLSQLEKKQDKNKFNQQRYQQIGSGERAEARRNYNFFRSEVIDYKSNKNLNLKDILEKGKLELFAD